MIARLLVFLFLACGRPAPPPDLGPVAAFRLQRASGGTLGSEDLAGRVWVANFIFTRCTTVCPVATERMARLQDRLAPLGDRVHLVSFSVDPEHDTPQVLADYARRHGADPARWSFLTGDAEAVRRTVVEGLHIAIERGADADGGAADTILHGSHFVLVDPAGHIRGYYDASSQEGLAELARDVEAVLPGAVCVPGGAC